MVMKKIAVVGPRRSYNAFIDIVDPRDREHFKHISRHNDFVGQEFQRVIRLYGADNDLYMLVLAMVR